VVISQQLYEDKPQTAPVVKEEKPSRPGFVGVLLGAGKVLLIAAGVLVGGFALLYLVVRIRYEYRKYKRNKKRREMAARGIYPKRKTAAGTNSARSGVKRR
jgi:hypothetical protein